MATQYAIYALKNVLTGENYVGKSKQPEIRHERHLRELRTGKHHSSKLQAAFCAYGELAFQWKLLQINIPEAEGSKWEIFWIAQLDSFNNGYNMNDGCYHGHKPPKSVIWNGTQYGSITSAAGANNLHISTLQYRISQGYEKESDVPHPTAPKMVIWNNTEYQSVNVAAKALGITHPAMLNRLKRGYTSDADMKRKKAA